MSNQAINLLEEGKFEEAIKVLTSDGNRREDGETDALLGLAHFQLGRYAEAADYYSAAVRSHPDNADWEAMRLLAAQNAVAEVNVDVPDVHFFDRSVLLARPDLPAGELPPKPPPAPRPRLTTRARILLGNALGTVFSVSMHGLTTLWGNLVGYSDEVWTNWYRRPQMLGILTLAYMRERLNSHNLKSTYPDGSLIGFQDPGQTPPEGVTHFRTANGSWNNLSNPMEGAAGTRFPRNVSNTVIRPETGEQLLTPNPRTISRLLLTRGEKMKEVPFLNLLAASWIQFENHDWITHGEMLRRETHEIPLPADDPARRRYHQTKLFVGKTQPDPTRGADSEKTPVTFINEVTHWWDCSQIYGSDQKTVDRLRSGVGGKLRLTDGGLLPLGGKGVEDTGMVRNWWLGLSMLHTLFAREHNAICDHLSEHYPDWDDKRLFNVARLINAAVTAKIHSVEWTPAVLPNPGLDMGLNANWFGILTNLLRSPANRKTVADINVRNPEMGGVVGNPIDKHGSPFGLTEEFVEVYRLHSFLPEALRLKSSAGDEEVPFVQTRQAGSAKITARIPMADLFHSFGTQHPGQLVLNNFPHFMQEMSIPGNPLFDMGAVDILRARERGVPRYNEFRRQLGLKPIRTFDDLFNPSLEGSRAGESFRF